MSKMEINTVAVVKNRGDHMILVPDKTCDCGCGAVIAKDPEYVSRVTKAATQPAPSFFYFRIGHGPKQ